MKTRRNLAVIVASGLGTRMNSELPKQFMDLSGKPVLAWTISCFERCRLIDEIIIVVPEDFLSYTSQAIVDMYQFRKIRKIITGGETRQESVLAGLMACPRTADKVAIHDGVRPIVRDTMIERLIETATETMGVVPAVQSRDTVKIASEKMMSRTLPRDKIYLAQTPQVFYYPEILRIHQRAAEEEFEGSDDAMLAEQYGMEVLIVPGYYDNIKITMPEDLILAREILKSWLKRG
jgi:2-C-methyl-D-erythritol 4-phosphate cytidylyltransferase